MSTPAASLAEGKRGLALGALLGFPIGVLSGFTGVGGGEYRAPVLLVLMGKVRWSIAVNLFIGTMVSVFNFVFRAGWTLSQDLLILTALLIVTSLPGAYVGALLTRIASAKVIKAILAGILIATGLRLILFETHASASAPMDVYAILLALALGFGLGIISGLLGLAAGEYRIPALILLFGVPTIVAGTVSSLAAIPPQVVGFLKHRHLQHTGPVTMRLGATMATASIAGVVLGVALLGRTTENLVAQVLGAAMILAAGRVAWAVRHPSPIEHLEETAAPAMEER